jgi:Protein of unknown function (DUF1573)
LQRNLAQCLAAGSSDYLCLAFLTTYTKLFSPKSTMKKVFALALALVLSAPVLTMAQAPAAGAATEKKSGAVMTPDESRFEFGTVNQGEIVDHTFTFRNTGTEPLVITNVGVSCGCTTPEYTKDPVMPGKAGKITARFNTTGKMGQQNKVLTVSSNNANGEVQLTLAGTVQEKGASAAVAPTATSSAAATTVDAKAVPVAKGKVKMKKADGKKSKVKMEDGKTEVKK